MYGRAFNIRTILPVTLAISVVTLTGSLARAGDTKVYKSVDAQGNVVYSDRSATPTATKTDVRFHEPSAADLARVEQQRQASQAAETRRVQETLTSSANHAQEQKAKKDKQARCDYARGHYYALRDATRIMQRDAQGNPVYLPDAEADAKRAEARKAMDAACAP